MRWTLFVWTLFVLASCSPEKRLARLLKKHPELVKRDTVRVADTVRVDGISRDTIFWNTITRDTIIINDRQLTIKYFNTGDSIFIKGECDTVTVIREVPVTTNTVEIVKEPVGWWVWLLGVVALLCAGGLGSLMFVLIRVRSSE